LITFPTWLGVEPAELSEVAENSKVFGVVLVLLPQQPSMEEKRSWKWINKWFIYYYFWKLLSKHCSTAILKH